MQAAGNSRLLRAGVTSPAGRVAKAERVAPPKVVLEDVEPKRELEPWEEHCDALFPNLTHREDRARRKEILQLQRASPGLELKLLKERMFWSV